MTPEEIAAAEAAQQAADAAKAAEAEKAKADAAAEEKKYSETYVKGLRSEAKGNREKLEAYEAAEKERKKAEMSEVDRLKAQLADSDKRAKALEISQVRTKAAAKHALPEDLHEFITADDEAGAEKQAATLAAKLKPAAGLPNSGGRNPANGGDAAAALERQTRFDSLRSGVPSLNNRVLK